MLRSLCHATVRSSSTDRPVPSETSHRPHGEEKMVVDRGRTESAASFWEAAAARERPSWRRIEGYVRQRRSSPPLPAVMDFAAASTQEHPPSPVVVSAAVSSQRIVSSPYASVPLNPDLHYSPILFSTMHVATDDPFCVRLVDAYEISHFEMPKCEFSAILEIPSLRPFSWISDLKLEKSYS
ncbi:hypothetical protein ACLOJK_041186 [Asimina triloba]